MAIITREQLIRKFRRLGYQGPYSGAKHQFMKKGQQKIRIPNPHKGRDIHISLLKEILKQAEISEGERVSGILCKKCRFWGAGDRNKENYELRIMNYE